jgi:hypothetical protein
MKTLHQLKKMKIMNNHSYTENELGDKPKELTMKEINEKYINRIIESLENDKELWTREVMCGMGGCFVDYYSPKYPTTDGGTLSFSDKEYVSAHIDGRIAWSVPFWMYHNPFSDKSRRLRRALNTMKVYLIEKDVQERLEKLNKSV